MSFSAEDFLTLAERLSRSTSLENEHRRAVDISNMVCFTGQPMRGPVEIQ
jgi:hypothetical protein